MAAYFSYPMRPTLMMKSFVYMLFIASITLLIKANIDVTHLRKAMQRKIVPGFCVKEVDYSQFYANRDLCLVANNTASWRP